MAWYSYVLGGVLILFALIIIAVILLQEGRRKGISGVISDAVLARWTKWIAILFGLLVVAAFVLSLVL